MRTAGLSALSRIERAALGATVIVTVLAGVARYSQGVSDVRAFAVATLALAGLAWIVSFSTEQVGQRFGPAVTGDGEATAFEGAALMATFVVLATVAAFEK